MRGAMAESSEQRVRILQDLSSMFGLSASDEDVAETFVSVAQEAFDATEAGVWLIDEDASLNLIGRCQPDRGPGPADPHSPELRAW